MTDGEADEGRSTRDTVDTASDSARSEDSSPDESAAVTSTDVTGRQYSRSTTQEGRQSPEPGQAVVTDRRSLSARVQFQWGVRVAVGVVILSAIVTFVLSRFDVDVLYGGGVLALLLVLGGFWVGLYYRRWVYQIRKDAIYLERGVVTHTRTLVPYVRIQHVDTNRGPLERALGLSTLVVYTAGSRGADVSIPGLTAAQARDLQQRIKELAIEAEGGDAL